MILMIDNYDSFTYNLYDYFRQLGCKIELIKNDQWTLDTIQANSPEAIIFSPGPGHPLDAGITLSVIQFFAGKIPLFGVCLGHQAIACAFGGQVSKSGHPIHGKVSSIHHDGKTIFQGLPSSFYIARYHSLVVDRDTLPINIEVSAWTDDGTIMAIRHKSLAIEGVQFHPEAILTDYGLILLKQFLEHYLN